MCFEKMLLSDQLVSGVPHVVRLFFRAGVSTELNPGFKFLDTDTLIV